MRVWLRDGKYSKKDFKPFVAAANKTRAEKKVKIATLLRTIGTRRNIHENFGLI